MKILIAGAAGRLGRALADPLEKRWQVVSLTRDELDITSESAVRAALDNHQPGLVINAAAFTDVDGAESRPAAAHEANALGPRNLARETLRREAALLNFSTDYVFDGAKETAYDENDAPAPLSVYGESKLAGEEEIRRHNPRHFIVRTAWLYDNRGESFAKRAIELAANHAEVRIVDDQRGSPTFLPHLADAVARLAATDAFEAGDAADWSSQVSSMTAWGSPPAWPPRRPLIFPPRLEGHPTPSSPLRASAPSSCRPGVKE